MSSLSENILAIMVDLLTCKNADTTILPALKRLETTLAQTDAADVAQEPANLIKTDDLAFRHPALHELVGNRIRVELIRMGKRAADISHISEPSRDDKRTRRGMVDWFERHWSRIEPIVPWMDDPESGYQEYIDDAAIGDEKYNEES
jgi:hypothetical protein